MGNFSKKGKIKYGNVSIKTDFGDLKLMDLNRGSKIKRTKQSNTPQWCDHVRYIGYFKLGLSYIISS